MATGFYIGNIGAYFASNIGGNIVDLSEMYSSQAPSDLTDPIISNVTPAPGQLTGISIAQRAATNIEFDVTDLTPGLRKVIVWAKLENDAQTTIVYDGDALRYPYLGAQSSVTTIANGLHFSIRPVNGWTSDIEELTVIAIDQAGNEEGD